MKDHQLIELAIFLVNLYDIKRADITWGELSGSTDVANNNVRLAICIPETHSQTRKHRNRCGHSLAGPAL